MIEKDKLRKAIESGRINVLNINYNKTGAIVCNAKKVVLNDRKEKSGVKLLEVYKHNNKILGAMVNEYECALKSGNDIDIINGLALGTNFHGTEQILHNLKSNGYDNVLIRDARVVSRIKHTEFKDVRERLIEVLSSNIKLPKIHISKKGKTAYTVRWRYMLNEPLNNMVKLLIEFLFVQENLSATYLGDNKYSVNCLDDIADFEKLMNKVFVTRKVA